MIGIETALRYQRYVQPSHKDILELTAHLKSATLADDPRVLGPALVEWTRRNIRFVNITKDLLGVEETLRGKRGNCFSVACVICSVLKSLGYNESYVVIAQAPDRQFENMLHSFAITETPDGCFVIDPISDMPLIRMSNVEKAQEVYGTIITAFNDSKSYIPIVA